MSAARGRIRARRAGAARRRTWWPAPPAPGWPRSPPRRRGPARTVSRSDGELGRRPDRPARVGHQLVHRRPGAVVEQVGDRPVRVGPGQFELGPVVQASLQVAGGRRQREQEQPAGAGAHRDPLLRLGLEDPDRHRGALVGQRRVDVHLVAAADLRHPARQHAEVVGGEAPPLDVAGRGRDGRLHLGRELPPQHLEVAPLPHHGALLVHHPEVHPQVVGHLVGPPGVARHHGAGEPAQLGADRVRQRPAPGRDPVEHRVGPVRHRHEVGAQRLGQGPDQRDHHVLAEARHGPAEVLRVELVEQR